MIIPATGIGADAAALYSARDKRRAHRTLRVLTAHIPPLHLRTPWLDVGAGESYMRDILKTQFNRFIEDYDVDIDREPYPCEAGKFRTITSFEVIEHLYNPLFHLDELCRVLHPQGNLIVVTPNDYSLIYKAEHLLSRKYRPHFHQFSERDLRDLFQKSNLEIVNLVKFFKSPSGTIARVSRNGFLVHARKKFDATSSS